MDHNHGSTALVRSGTFDHHHEESDHHDGQVVYVHNHHISNDIDVTFEGMHGCVYASSDSRFFVKADALK